MYTICYKSFFLKLGNAITASVFDIACQGGEVVGSEQEIKMKGLDGRSLGAILLR